MSIKIIKAGVLATVQGGERLGHRGIGVGSGGAMDSFAMKVSNYLCGNEDDMAVMEINFPSPEILFQKNALVALAGADLAATINENAIPVWRAVWIKEGSILKFMQPVSGARAYLAVHGGWQAEKWLNSYSTHLKLGAGGFHGRALQKDDSIDLPAIDLSFESGKVLPWNISENGLNRIYQPVNNIRCIKGVEYDLLNESSKQNFEQNDFLISNQSDRMGYRLNAKPLSLEQSTELISSAVDAGIVQLLPDGNCIVLMADHQTTGGYPRIASVIKADLPKIAQLSPGQSLNFKIVSLEQAEDALIYMQQMLKEIKEACQINLKKYLQL